MARQSNRDEGFGELLIDLESGKTRLPRDIPLYTPARMLMIIYSCNYTRKAKSCQDIRGCRQNLLAGI
jgi:hypothetical protein